MDIIVPTGLLIIAAIELVIHKYQERGLRRRAPDKLVDWDEWSADDLHDGRQP